MLRYLLGFCGSEKQSFALPGFTAFLEHLAVDLRLVAAFDDQRQAGCRKHLFNGFSDETGYQ